MKRKQRTEVTPEMLERMKQMRKEGSTYRKIAAELNLSPMTVYKRLKSEKKVGFLERLKRKLK